MSILDDARRLAATDPWYENERAGTSFCIACGMYESHADDCPWLALPRIVAALEAAERLASNGWPGTGDWRNLQPEALRDQAAYLALVNALRGEEVKA